MSEEIVQPASQEASHYNPLASYRASRRWLLLQFLLMWAILGALLVFQLERRPLTGSEVAMAQMAVLSPRAAFHAAVAEGRAPLYPVLSSLFLRHHPGDAVSLRYLSILFAWLAFLPAYLLVRQVSHLGAYSFLFCILFATSPFWVQMGRMATNHSLFAFWAIASTAFLFRALGRPKWYSWVGYTVCLIGMLYSGMLALAVILSHGAAALSAKHWTPARSTFGRIAVMLVCCLLALGSFFPVFHLMQTHYLAEHVRYEKMELELPMLQRAGLFTGYSLYMFLFGDSISPWNALRTVLFSLIALVGGVTGLARIFEHHHRSLRALFVCAVLAYAIVLGILLLFVPTESPFAVPLRVAFLYPFFCLAGAYGLGVMNKTFSIPLLLLVLGIHGYSHWNYFHQRQYTNWQYAVPVVETLQAIRAHEQPGTLLLIDGDHLGEFAYFYHGPLKMKTLESNDGNIAAAAREAVGAFGQVLWLHWNDDSGRDPLNASVEETLLAHFQKLGSLPFLRENAAANELRSYLAGHRIARTKYLLDVYGEAPAIPGTEESQP